jgi:16S rRNA processing protein RimM
MPKAKAPADWILIARITGAHGIQGVLKAHSFAESEEIFKPGSRLKVEGRAGQSWELTVEWVKSHGQGIRIAFKEIRDRSQAESLAGARLFINKSSLPDLNEDTYYWFDLIGLSVFSTDGEFLGRVESILPTGSNDVYVVRQSLAGSEKEILIPALASVILDIDLKNRIMRVNRPEEV